MGITQGRNEVCGIRDRRDGITDQKGGIWDHSPGIRDQRLCRIGISRFFRGQGHTFGIKDQKFACKNGISEEKNISCYHPVLLECPQRHRSSLLFVYLLLFYHYAVAVREDVTFLT